MLRMGIWCPVHMMEVYCVKTGNLRMSSSLHAAASRKKKMQQLSCKAIKKKRCAFGWPMSFTKIIISTSKQCLDYNSINNCVLFIIAHWLSLSLYIYIHKMFMQEGTWFLCQCERGHWWGTDYIVDAIAMDSIFMNIISVKYKPLKLAGLQNNKDKSYSWNL